MDTLTISPCSYDLFVALDVDKNSYSLTIKDNYNMEKAKKMPANPESFYAHIQKTYPQKKVLYAYEAGPTGYGLSDYLLSKNERCLVVSPNSIPKASNDKVKTNRIDSKRLSELLKAGLLESIRVPDETYRQLRHLTCVRQNYAKKQKIAKQQIEALLLFEDIKPFLDEQKRWSNKHIQILKELTCSACVRIRLDALLSDLSYARAQILHIHKQIKEFCLRYPDLQRNIEYTRSVSGIGFITATYAISRIGNPSLLTNIREIAGFVGLAPSEHSTGDTVNRGHITHLGDTELRRLLIEAAWIAIRKDAELGYFYNRIKNRHLHKGGAQIAIVAVARKLTQRIYKVLKEQRMYIVH